MHQQQFRNIVFWGRRLWLGNKKIISFDITEIKIINRERMILLGFILFVLLVDNVITCYQTQTTLINEIKNN